MILMFFAEQRYPQSREHRARLRPAGRQIDFAIPINRATFTTPLLRTSGTVGVGSLKSPVQCKEAWSSTNWDFALAVKQPELKHLAQDCEQNRRGDRAARNLRRSHGLFFGGLTTCGSIEKSPDFAFGGLFSHFIVDAFDFLFGFVDVCLSHSSCSS
jgi:hypothetical protein